MSLSSTRRLPIPLLIAVVSIACGKKGPPLPPLLRIPAPVEASATRLDDQVYVRLKVPTANADGTTPADIARVEVYAITADRAPLPGDDVDRLRRRSTLVASHDVRRPVPPPPQTEPGQPPPPPLPLPPGVEQGAELVVREQLTPDMVNPVALGDAVTDANRRSGADRPPGPLMAGSEPPSPTRYYYVVGASARGRYGPTGPFLAVPLGPTSGAPGPPEFSYNETTLTLTWRASSDARGVPPPTEAGTLPSKPIVAGPEPTAYHVYEVRRNETPAMPVPLTSSPLFAVSFATPVGAFGAERCFYVRPVDIVNGVHVNGPASAASCVTPKDTFPPAPPTSLAAVASEGAIHLIWEPSPSGDVAGYLVLRSRLPDDTLQPASGQPIPGTTFIDEGIRPGASYAYVVVAVDKAGNRSEGSNREEVTARQ